jgi:DNA repair exonuclease SbcCD ATPase subunit
MNYAVFSAIVFIVVLILLIINIIKLKSAKADAVDKATRLERYATITDAEAEADRIINAAKQTAEELDADSQRILAEAKNEAANNITASEADAKSITQRADNILSDARVAAKRIHSEALAAVETQEAKRAEIDNQIEELRKSYREKKITYNQLEEALSIYKDDMEFADMGFYAPHFDFDTSASFQNAIKACRDRQKILLRDKTPFGAIHCPTEWTVGGSKSEGRKMTTRGIQMTARAFNGECDAAIANCTFKNVQQMEQRIYKAFDALNKMNEINRIYINRAFLDMKLDELRLTHEYRLKKQEEREEQREIRAQMAEEKRAQAEIDRALREAEEEERRAKKALDKARKEMKSKLEQMTAEQVAKHQEKVTELENALDEALQKGQKALSMAQQTKRGHVYVISNVGSFGENVFKIGMTRRLDPQDRVDELGSASVPFLFDVHAMIFSEDAPAMENLLHQRFNDQRTNLVNKRKEFFNVKLEDIKDAVFDIAGNDVDFIETASAQHYYETQAIRKQHEAAISAVEKSSKEPRFAEAL